MSNTVDTRVVEMQFDNKLFEKNVQTSVESLELLKKSLDFEKSVKGLEALDNTFKNFSLHKINEGVSELRNSFSVLGVMGQTVIQNLTNHMINAGRQMANGLTESARSGFSEYETQMNAVQTILANTSDAMTKAGYSEQQRLDIVNEKLDELNHYADKTIYNFTEMTNNIGRFTAAGIELNTAVTAIQGIANLAAVSGSTSQQASTAMYQLSQALSTGTLKLQDWNSVVNAGMGGEIFQKALIRTAMTMGVTVDKTVTEVNSAGKKVKKTVKRNAQQLIEEAGSFRESLKDGWITSDVLTATLEQFSWDFEEIAKNTHLTEEELLDLQTKLIDKGYSLEEVNRLISKSTNLTVEEAKNLKRAQLIAKGYTSDEADEIINLAQTATEAATKVKTLTQLFDTLKEAMQSGWTQTWEYIIGDFDEAKELFTSISDYFGKIIETSSESRNAIVEKWKDLGGRDSMIASFWNIVYAFENISKQVKNIFADVFPPATGKQLYDATKRVEELTKSFLSFTEDAESMEKVTRIFRGFASAVDIVKKGIKFAYQEIRGFLGLSSDPDTGFLDYLAGIADWVTKLRDNISVPEAYGGILKKLGTAAASVRDLFVDGLRKIFELSSETFGLVKDSDFFSSISQGFTDIIDKVPNAVERLRSFGKSIRDYIKNSDALNDAWGKTSGYFRNVVDNIKKFNTKFKDALKAFMSADVSDKNTIFEKLRTRFSSFSSEFGSWYDEAKSAVISNWEKIRIFLTEFFTSTVPSFFESSVSWFGKVIDKVKTVDWLSLVNKLLGFWSLIKTVKGFSDIAIGIKDLGNGFKQISSGIESMLKYGKGEADTIGDTLLKIAGSIGILIAAIYILAKMDNTTLFKGLGLLGLISLELVAISAIMKKTDVDGDVFLKTAGALTLMVIPIFLLSRMDFESALKGMFAIGIILTELALFTRMAGDGFEKKTAFVGIAVAVDLLVLAVKGLASMDLGGLAKGLGGLEVLFLELSSFMKKVGGIGKIGGLVAMAIAVNLMVLAVKNLGKLNMKTIAKGVLALGGIMELFGRLMSSAKGFNAGNGLVMLLSIAGTLGLFVLAFKQVEDADTGKMLQFATAFSEVLLAFAGSMKIISMIPAAGAIQGAIGAIGGFGLLLVGLIGILEILDGINIFFDGGFQRSLERGGEILETIGRAIGRFGAGFTLGLTDTLPDIGTNLSTFMTNMQPFFEGCAGISAEAFAGASSFASVMLDIAWAEIMLKLATLFGADPITKYAGDITLLGLSLKAFSFLVSGFNGSVGKDVDKAIEAGKALIRLLTEVPWDAPDWAKDLFGSRDTEQLKTDINNLGTALTTFAANVSGFSGEDQATTDDITAAITAANGIADLLEKLPDMFGVLQFFTGFPSLALFGAQLPEFANNLKTYATNISGFSKTVTTTDIKNSNAAAGALVDFLNALPDTEGGWPQFWGFPSLKTFSADLPKFADNLKTYAKNISGFSKSVTENDVKFSTSAAVGLKDLLIALPDTEGGWPQFWGFPDLGTFAQDIAGFATAMNSYAHQISGFSYSVTEDDVTNSTRAAKGLRDLLISLPPQKGMWQRITGFKDLGDFAADVEALGGALSSFATSIAAVKGDEVTKATGVVTDIKKFVNSFFEHDNIFEQLMSLFSSNGTFDDLLKYTAKMKTFGEDLSAFSLGVQQVQTSDVEKASEVFDKIIKFADTFKDYKSSKYQKSLNNVLETAKQFRDIGERVGWGAAGFNQFGEADKYFEKSKTVLTAFRNFNDEVKTWSDDDTISVYRSEFANMWSFIGMMEEYGKSIGKFSENLGNAKLTDLTTAANAFNTFVTTASTAHGLDGWDVTKIQEILNGFSTLVIPVFDSEGIANANAFITSLTEGIQNGGSIIESASKSTAEFGVSGAKSTLDSWTFTGAYLGMGMRNGIASMAGAIRSAAVNAARGAIQAIQVTWSVHSPSRVGEDLGMFFDLGLAGGIGEYAKTVVREAGSVGRAVVDSTKSLLTNLDSGMFDYIDPNPTIRPVMDLSRIQTGVDSMNALFAQNPMMSTGFFSGSSFARGVNGLTFDGAKIVGGNDNHDIVNELQILTDRFDDLSEAVANMKIVLDSGTLVGQTSAKMDNQLGTIAMRKNRGN